MITLNDITTLLGLIIGFSAFALSIFNYYRDKAKIRIVLQWDMQNIDNDELYGIVFISNIGRRPIYVSHLVLELPKTYDSRYLLISEGRFGNKLAEGDEPLKFLIPYEKMYKYKKDWRNIIAQVTDSSGKIWKSNRVKVKPLWAE